MILEEILEKAAYARPGYSLASFKEAALPIYLLTARVLTLDRKSLNPIEEGCLRAVDAGLSSPGDVCEFLGLSKQVLNSILAGLNARECISYRRAVGADSAQVLLTEKGRTALTELRSIEPEERIIKLVFDPFLKQVAFVPASALMRPREIKELGWMEVPLCGAKRPEVVDVPLTDIDKVLQRLPRKDDEARELLALRRIERRELHFLPCVVLFYRAISGRDIQVAFYRDEGFSFAHEAAFRELGGPEQIGANHVLKGSSLEDLGPIVQARTGIDSLEDIVKLEAEIAAAAAAPTGSPSSRGIETQGLLVASGEDAKRKLRAMTQRLVRCHEHPRLLHKALTESKHRLLIISPWITHQVVDDSFVAALEALLVSGVKVFIGYGLAEDDDAGQKGKARRKAAISERAQRALEPLQNKFPDFVLRFIGNTHRKHLVSDGVFAVVSSFNWLSFRGDPRRRARDELGFLISEPSGVDQLFADGLELLQQGYDHPS